MKTPQEATEDLRDAQTKLQQEVDRFEEALADWRCWRWWMAFYMLVLVAGIVAMIMRVLGVW